MNTEIKNAVSAADEEAQYDTQAKRVLGNKIILGHILAGTIEAFQGMSPEEAAACIEGTPYISQVPVEPGLTNAAGEDAVAGERIVGLNTENAEINEGMVRFDIVCYVRTGEGRSQIILNVECQKDDPDDYAVLNRGLFYVSRLISSQKERDFEKSRYDDIRSVYSVWICMNMKENSFSHVHLVQERHMGSRDWPGKLDLMNVILIGVAEALPGKEAGYELHRLLGTLFSPELTVKEKLGIMETEYHIPMEDNIRKDVIGMCTLGHGVWEKGEAAGREIGQEIGEKIGEKNGIEAEKIATIKRMYRKGYSLEMIADASDKTPEEVEAILSGKELQTV